MKSTLSLKEFTKVLLFTILMLVCGHDIHAQQTTLTVDCQTPGCLSSKIGYKDQLLVENLTITGYLNKVDIEFLSRLPKLKRLDLLEMECIDNSKDLKSLENLNVCSIKNEYKGFVKSDTLYTYGKGTLKRNIEVPQYLYIGEGIDSIPRNVLGGGLELGLKKVHLPTTVSYLNSHTFSGDTIEANIDGLAVIEHGAFRLPGYLKQDTIRLSPKLKKWYTCSFNIKDNDVIYIPKSVEYIDERCIYDRGHISDAHNNLGSKRLEIFYRWK